METTSLIDLSSPAKDYNTQQPTVTSANYSQDFTPKLSKALAECFKRRKQSLLPTNLKHKLSDDNSMLSFINESPDLSMSALPTAAENDQKQKVSFDTPDTKLNSEFNWGTMLQGTPSYSPNLDQENKDRNSVKSSKSPIKCISTAELHSEATEVYRNSSPKVGNKRGPSTPMTPSLLKKSVKRRVLEDKSTNRSEPGRRSSYKNHIHPGSLFTPTQLDEQPWTINCVYSNSELGHQYHKSSPSSEAKVSAVETPNSVLQMRHIIKCRQSRRSSSRRSRSLTASTSSLTSPPAQSSALETERSGQKTGSDLHVSCRKKEQDLLLDAAYDKWLAEKQLKELQELVEFMELEREFSL